jgi:hypothetical protein
MKCSRSEAKQCTVRSTKCRGQCALDKYFPGSMCNEVFKK